MEINLPPHLQNYIDSAIASGEFKTAEQVVNTALEKLKDEEQRQSLWLRNEIEDSFTDHPDNNTCVSFEEWKKHMHKMIASYGAQTRDNS